MQDFWELLEATYRIVQRDVSPGDWQQLTAVFSGLPHVHRAQHVTQGTAGLTVRAHDRRDAEVGVPDALAAALHDRPEHPGLVTTEVSTEIGIPLVGHQAHYGWLWLTLDDSWSLTRALSVTARHMGALLGLWADVAGRDPHALLRAQTLFRTVLWGDHLILRATCEENMVEQTGTRLFESGLLSAVAILQAGTSLFEAGHWDKDGAARIDVPVLRGGKPWGTLAVQIAPPHAHDADVADLIRWFGELLGHGLDEWDVRQQLERDEARQRYLATHDALTGLETRRAFLEAMPAALADAKEHGTWLAVGMLDLDNFKPCNDTYGHDAGDKLLQLWSHRLSEVLSGPHRLARIGGDEFAFLVSGMHSAEELESFLAHMFRISTTPLSLTLANGMVVDVTVNASAGISVAPNDPSDPDELMRHADLALYRAKDHKASRSRPWSWYESSVASPSRHQAHIPDGVRVHYQPIVDVASGHVHSLEALVRLWDGRTLWAPGQFLSELTSDELQQLTFQVLEQVLEDMQDIDAVWDTEHAISISLNLEPAMLSSDCIRHIGQQVAQAAIAPERITLELLETSDFLSQSMARHQLQVLKEKRFQLALDDVGSAYSSLLRIKELPIDTLKLDQAFVRNIPDHPDDLIFVIAMQTLARGFRSHFVAEGVEDTAILDALQVLGVDRVQGYVFTKPLPLSDLLAWGRRFESIPADGKPHSLLGAYAAHLAYQHLDRVVYAETDPKMRASACPMSRYLQKTGQRHTPLGDAHIAYHEAEKTGKGAGDATPSNDLLKELLMAAIHDAEPLSAHVH